MEDDLLPIESGVWRPLEPLDLMQMKDDHVSIKPN